MAARRQWLLLGFTILARQSNARVKAWRRLQQLSAVLWRNAVYVLPQSAQGREDFEWIRRQIVDGGGEATIFVAEFVDSTDEEALMARFRQTAHAEYREIRREADRVVSSARHTQRAKGRPSSAPTRRVLASAARSLRSRFDAVVERDLFAASGRQDAAEALNALESIAAPPTPASRAERPHLSTDAFQRRRWVTRPRPGVDRMASAWLIRRFIDPRATFAFSDQRRDAEVSFDMFGGDFTHEADRCTFEVLAERFAIRDPIVSRVGRIVHDLDLKETRYAAPETPAVAHMVEGLRMMHPDDGTLLEQGIGMFESLARSFAATDVAPTSPPRGSTRTTAVPRARHRSRKARG